MTKGPFKKWVHKHEFIEEGEHSSKLEDRVDWKLPFHFFTKFFSGILVTPRMKQMFRHRTRRVKADLNRHQTYANSPRQRILVSGSTGLIGEQLVAFLLTGGHEVHRLIRKSTKLAPDANKKNVVLWDDIEGKIIEGSLENFDAIIHLAGAGIGDKRWNKKRKTHTGFQSYSYTKSRRVDNHAKESPLRVYQWFCYWILWKSRR